MKEAKEGDFTLVYNTDGEQKPVALTVEQHAKLQILIKCIGGGITVVGGLTLKAEIDSDLPTSIKTLQNEANL